MTDDELDKMSRKLLWLGVIYLIAAPAVITFLLLHVH